MKKRASGLLAGVLAATLGLTGVAAADERPDEGTILLEELPKILERTASYVLPPDPDGAAESLATLPQGAENVIAMHLGRLYPTPHESMPGIAPLVGLLGARANLLADPQHHQKKLQDSMNGEVAIPLMPFDAVTAIVILPTEIVKSDPKATPLPERRVDLSGVTYEIGGETRTVEQYMKDGATNAIAFLHDGEYIFDAFQNGTTPASRHHLWSATKSVTTSLVGIAVDEGLVDSVLDPIEKYIPETVGTDWEGTSVEDLLQMESGIYWVDVPVHQPEQLVAMGFDFHTNGLAGMTRNEYLLQLTRVSEPGTHHRYNSGDTQMLAWLLENVYDDSYSTILSEKLWQPAGMESDAAITVDRRGDAFASMGLFTTVKDAIRFGELFRNGGRNLQGEQVVPEAWVEASTDYSQETGGPRGYQWYPWSEGYSAVGFGHQRISVAPDLEMVGVRFGTDPVDTIAPAEWESLYLAVADEIGAGEGTADPGDPGDGDGDDGNGNGDDGSGSDGNGDDGNGNTGNGKGGGTGGGRDDAPGQQGRQRPSSQQIQMAGSVTDGAPIPDATPFLLALGLAVLATATLTRGRATRR